MVIIGWTSCVPMVRSFMDIKIQRSRAVDEQRKLGSVFNHPHEVSVELAEKLN